jgi:DeoR/GlpR family transcriptional regulator of sugar metabolism
LVVGGISVDFMAFTNRHLTQAQTQQLRRFQREAIRRVAKFAVLADYTKWGIRGFSSFAELSEAYGVITTDELAREALSTLRKNIKKVLVAKP